ncbi:MAG: ATP-binding protein, partial [Sphingomonadaceae bacterium]
VGQLTGGIAHDFNNMLAVVVGGLELAKRKLHKHAADAERHLDNAMEGANRAAALTRRLLAFARAEPLLPQAANPDTLVRGMNDLMDRTLGERIRLEVDSVANPWLIWVDRHQLENAILNLAVNARDAMENGGKLTIRTSNVKLDADEVGESLPGEYVRVDVTDTGCGMSKDVLDRVFEPFFTTKPVGKGTGLGLSQIFGFVRQSGGEISIASAEGLGTTVSLYLPRHNAAPTVDSTERPVAARAAAPQAAPGSRTALVVEDDPRVLAATSGALEELGIRTVCAASAETAMAILEKNSTIDIIVTDVIMPGMTGPEFVAKVGPLYPDVAILFVTGYADVDDADAFCGHAVLRKPFTISTLENAVESALGTPPRAFPDKAGPPYRAGKALTSSI